MFNGRTQSRTHARRRVFALCQDGNDRQVKPIAVQSIKRNRDGTAVDRERNEVRKGFMVKVLEGPFKGRGGKVLPALAHSRLTFCAPSKYSHPRQHVCCGLNVV
jgi:hypothetical protein